jgi:hypothetical protein
MGFEDGRLRGMPTSQEIPGALSAVPGWLPEATFWAVVALLFVALAATVGIWTLVARMRELGRQNERLATLDEILHKVSELVAARDDLDLRRIEHVLIDLRDAQGRLEEAFLRAVESMARGGEGIVISGAGEASGIGGGHLGERVVNRLLALGYERVQIVTAPGELDELVGGDGEVLVEARRGGAQHKGRVVIRSGGLADVEISSSYSAFP